MKMAYLIMSAGLCAIASGAWGAVSLHEKGGMENRSAPSPSAVERTNKSDRMVRAFNVRGAMIPAFSVEILDFPGAAVTIRDPEGSILYGVSPTERMTVAAKRAAQNPVVTPARVPAPLGSGSSETAMANTTATAAAVPIEGAFIGGMFGEVADHGRLSKRAHIERDKLTSAH
jgi:hypothetical protein